MIDISIEKNILKNYERGEDVRDAFINACKKISDVQLPAVTTADAEKVLTVNSSGRWGVENWQT